MDEKPVADKHGEMLHFYNPQGKVVGTLSRKEIHQKGLINKHVAYTVTNQQDEVLLQLRAKDKSVNANQCDKPGGHIGINASLTEEFLEEMCYQIPGISAVIVSPEEYDSVLQNTDLSKTAVLTKLETLFNYDARRIKQDGSEKIEVIHLELFKGRYDGPTSPQPGEVQRIKTFSRIELETAIVNNPRSIGNDMQDIMKQYGNEIF